MTVNDSARPAARATGPALCSLIAAPTAIGTSGSTQGDRVDSKPASSARPTALMSARRRAARSDRFRQQPLDRGGIGVAGRASRLAPALEDDQRALFLHVEFAQQLLLRIEIDREGRKPAEARLGLEA